MTRIINKISKKRGLAPGALVHVGEKKTEHAQISLIRYGEGQIEEKVLERIDDYLPVQSESGTKWINVNGIDDARIIDRIGQLFHIHPLTLEDVMNSGQRPKTEDFDDYLYVVFKMLYFDETENEVIAEQVSLVFGKDYILSFQEVEKDVFSSVRDRIRKGKGRIRNAGTDYLAYCLIDAVVDQYFTILEVIGEKIECLEEEIIFAPAAGTIENIHELKREMIFMRKQIWPMREMVNNLARADTDLVDDTTHVYLRDVYDHTIQIIDTIESYRDILSGMLDIYLSTLSNKMNEVMKVLTIIATIFIPITFVAGVYGMNFKYMPELEWRWGYLSVWLVMSAIILVMLLFFKKKTWL
ncbi:MAG: magnesium/cobalt transporter CorA [Desulfobacterales bacterium]|nr:magnesium/cobalt transporter CorA [Desulfobacterales bacterium]